MLTAAASQAPDFLRAPCTAHKHKHPTTQTYRRGAHTTKKLAEEWWSRIHTSTAPYQPAVPFKQQEEWRKRCRCLSAFFRLQKSSVHL